MAAGLGLVLSDRVEMTLTTGGLLALPYLLLRLVDDFPDCPAGSCAWPRSAWPSSWWRSSSFSPKLPGWLVLLALVYLVGFLIYDIAAFVRESRGPMASLGGDAGRGGGVGLLMAISCSMAWAQGCLIGEPLATHSATWRGLVSSLFYFVRGLRRRSLLRRAWQEPELPPSWPAPPRLPRLPDTEAILREMERGAAHGRAPPGHQRRPLG